jgi:hypothetical protein
MRRKRLLLVTATTGYQSQMFAEAAQGLQFDLVLATDRCHVLDDPWGDNAVPIRFEDPEGAIAAVSKAGAFDGIVALGDRPAIVAAAIARGLGLPFHSLDAAMACRNKNTARRRFQEVGLLVPDFYRASLADGPERALAGALFPCVLKPLGLSGSRGVIRADSEAEFLAAFLRIEALLNAPDIARAREEQDRFIQIERFIPGRELALEGLVTDGHLQVLALFDKPDALDGPFFEETIYTTPSVQPSAVQASIRDATERAVQALGLTHGPIHAEMRVNASGVWMLEVAGRPIGGLCARVLPGLAEVILWHAIGEAVPSTGLLSGAAGVMMIPIPRPGVYVDAGGVDIARDVPGIEDVVITAKTGQRLVRLPEGNSYLGFIFARGTNPSVVETSIREAHAKLRFEIQTALDVV